MKIITKVGNLLNVGRGHIVHGCNSRGVMGSGVALGIRKTYPKAYENYISTHTVNGLELGTAYGVIISDELVIWNAITQEEYGLDKRYTSYDAIQTCFEQINNSIKDKNESYFSHPKEIHIPLIGAGRGGGNWEIIREIIEQTVEFPVTLWLPDNTVNTI